MAHLSCIKIVIMNDFCPFESDFFKNWAILGLFFVDFGPFQTKNINFTTFNVKNVHPGTIAGIQTHDLLNISFLIITTRSGLKILNK